MKSKYIHEIEKRLQDRGFKQSPYVSWIRKSEFQIVLKLWTEPIGSDDEYDIDMVAEIWLESSLQNSPCFLAKEEMSLTDELIEKKGYAWIDEVIQDLYKYAYDILVSKAKIAAEAAITGIE